jgi:uncharacterized protein
VSRKVLRVEHLSAAPGTTVQGYWEISEMADGTPARIPVALINGKEEGPILYLQAVSDGDELNGIAVIRQILRRADPARLRGGIIAVPILNIHAFHDRSAHSPVDGKKMNRCFPGKPDGTSSERIAHQIFHKAVLQASLCVDLHQGGVRPMIDEVRVRVDRRRRQHRDCLELGRVFGIGYILDSEGPDGQLAKAAPDHGIPTIDPELGGCHGWDGSSIRKGVTGVENVLRHYGMMPGRPRIPERQVVVDGFTTVLSNRGGFLEYRADLYAHLQSGEPVAEVTDPFGNVLETLRAPHESILWSRSLYPMVAAGEAVATLGKNIRYI